MQLWTVGDDQLSSRRSVDGARDWVGYRLLRSAHNFIYVCLVLLNLLTRPVATCFENCAPCLFFVSTVAALYFHACFVDCDWVKCLPVAGLDATAGAYRLARRPAILFQGRVVRNPVSCLWAVVWCLGCCKWLVAKCPDFHLLPVAQYFYFHS